MGLCLPLKRQRFMCTWPHLSSLCVPSPVRVLWVEINETDWCTRASFFLLQLLICYTARLSDNNNLAEHPIINRSQGEYWRAVCTWHTHAHTARGSWWSLSFMRMYIQMTAEAQAPSHSLTSWPLSLSPSYLRALIYLFHRVMSFTPTPAHVCYDSGLGAVTKLLARLSSCVCFEPSSAGTRRPSSLTQMRLSPVCAFVVRLRRLQLALRLSGGYTTAGAARFGWAEST